MANTEPQVAFKLDIPTLDIPTLDNLRRSLLRDYEMLTKTLTVYELQRQHRQEIKQPLEGDELQRWRDASKPFMQAQFQVENLLRHFSVDESDATAAQSRGQKLAQVEHARLVAQGLTEADARLISAQLIVDLIHRTELTVLEVDEIEEAARAQLV